MRASEVQIGGHARAMKILAFFSLWYHIRRLITVNMQKVSRFTFRNEKFVLRFKHQKSFYSTLVSKVSLSAIFLFRDPIEFLFPENMFSDYSVID